MGRAPTGMWNSSWSKTQETRADPHHSWAAFLRPATNNVECKTIEHELVTLRFGY